MTSFLAAHQHFLGLLLQALRTGIWLVLLTAIFAPLEHFFSVQPSKFFYKGWLTNLGWYFVNSLVPVFLLGPPSALIAMGIHAILARFRYWGESRRCRSGLEWLRRWWWERSGFIGVIAGHMKFRSCGASTLSITARPR